MEKEAKTQETTPVQTVYVPIEKKEDVKVICEVCGHANPLNTAVCKNCSNYLN
jgi:ribosomal protein L40E